MRSTSAFPSNSAQSYYRIGVYRTTPGIPSVSSTRRVMSEAKREWVTQAIKTDSVVIFSKTYCPFCTMAKEVFEKLKQAYHVIELDNRDDSDEIQDILKEITGARTVPRVFVKGEFIGGGTEVKKMYANGELAKKLA